MNNLTTEERAKIFALYLGCDIRVTDSKKVVQNVFIDSTVVYLIDNGKIQLLLKPLDALNDEDAIEVAKLAANRPSHYGIHEADISRRENSVDVVFLDRTSEVINLSFCGDTLLYRFVDSDHKIIEERVSNQAAIIDYLRSKSYMLPYKGINLFTEGIAIEHKQTT